MTKYSGPKREAMIAAMARRYEAGEGIRKLAAETGYSYTQMRAILAGAGVKFRTAGGAGGAK